MSTATSTQTSSTECPSTESSTTAADPVLTREEASRMTVRNNETHSNRASFHGTLFL